MPTVHVPVMIKEAMYYLNLPKGAKAIDCTLGGGGYTEEMAHIAGRRGRILAIDLDPGALERAGQRLENKYQNIIFANGNFKDLPQIISGAFPKEKDIRFDGIVFDLGLSSDQLADRGRGISFQSDGPLSMNFNPVIGALTAEYILNNYGEKELETVFRQYGEEKYARNIAKNIIKQRAEDPIVRAGQLVDLIGKSVPRDFRKKPINPATKIFQALRIEANDELTSLREVLPKAIEYLKSGGVIVVVSYHSLEDRIVKNFFRNESEGCLCPPKLPVCRCHHRASLKILTRKPVRPSSAEVGSNPRSRSALLRAAQRI